MTDNEARDWFGNWKDPDGGRMNEEIKREWVEALRSGDYTQGSGYLHLYSAALDQSTFCCLGVLCSIAEKHDIATSVRRPDGVVTYDRASDVLPASVVEWADLPSENPCLPDTETQPVPAPLSVLNDELNVSFDDLADLIEKYL